MKVSNVFIFFVLSMVVVACGSLSFSDEDELRVLSDGSGDFATLELAIESATADSTISLGEGTFRLKDHLIINKPLTLKGEGVEKTIIVGENAENVILYEGAGLLKIQDIAIRREGDFPGAVMVVLGGEVDFRNCRFSNGVSSPDREIGSGLVFFNDSTGIVKNCEIDNNAEIGILVSDQAKPELIDNNIQVVCQELCKS